MLRSRLVAAPLSFLIWASWVAIVILWTPLVFFYRLATWRFDPGCRRIGCFFRNSAVLAGATNPFWDLRIVDEIRPDPSRAHVFVANHRSNADVFLIVRLLWETKLLAKRSIMRVPLLGWQMRTAGDVEILRGAGAGLKESQAYAFPTLGRPANRSTTNASLIPSAAKARPMERPTPREEAVSRALPRAAS